MAVLFNRSVMVVEFFIDLVTLASNDSGQLAYACDTKQVYQFDGTLWGSPSIANSMILYLTGTLKSLARVYVGTSTISGGVGNAVFYLTDNQLASGVSRFPTEVFLDSIQPVVRDGGAGYSFGTPTVSSDRITLTLPVTKFSSTGVVVLGISVIGTVSMVAAPNGTVVKITIFGN